MSPRYERMQARYHRRLRRQRAWEQAISLLIVALAALAVLALAIMGAYDNYFYLTRVMR